MSAPAKQPAISLTDIGLQGVLLFGGMGLSQLLSFARNAILGHTLSPYDFGVAASITLLLQTVETLSDLGHDRLIVQAEDGDSASFLATTHTISLLRGVLLAAILYALAPWAARFFAVCEAEGAFALVALVPLIKGAMHLDCRRAQRRLDNRPQMLIEAVPQAIALALTLPAVRHFPGFEAVVVLAIIQAAAAMLLARYLATSPYRLGFDAQIARRLVIFGWPILLSALPLAAVYQGDRAIIGRLAGMEALAAYSAAFMITMVPGLLAARAGHSLMLPIFASTLRDGRKLASRFGALTEATTVLAALYLGVFIVAGGQLLPLAFGGAYGGYGNLIAVLAAMWAMRMIQAVPGMALMAAGQTKPFLVAGLIRAAALPAALYAALHGAPLWAIAVTGCVGELASLLYVSFRLERLQRGLAAMVLTRSLFLVPVAVLAHVVSQLGSGLAWAAAEAALISTLVVACGIGLMPGLLAQTRRLVLHNWTRARLEPT